MIYVPKNLPKKYSAVFIALMVHLIYDEEISVQNLIVDLQLNNTYYNRSSINQCIEYLISNNYIIGSKIKRNVYNLYKKEINLKGNDYYTIAYEDFSSIINLNDQCNRLDLIDYFLLLCSTINYRTRVGFTSLNTLSKKTGYNMATIIKYNKILQDNHILFIATSKKQGVSNRYGLYKDKANVINEARKAGIWVDNKRQV